MRNTYFLVIGIIIAIIAALFFNISIVDAQCAFPSVDGMCGQGSPFAQGEDSNGVLILLLVIIFGMLILGKTNGE